MSFLKFWLRLDSIFKLISRSAIEILNTEFTEDTEYLVQITSLQLVTGFIYYVIGVFATSHLKLSSSRVSCCVVVWGCTWHSCGDFVASCSMDNSSKIWDLNRLV